MIIIIITLVFLLTQYMANQQPSDQKLADLETKVDEVTNRLAEEVLEYHDKECREHC